AEKLDMTDGIKSLLGDLVEQEMAAARAAQADAEAAGEEAAGIGVYEAEDDPDADDAFYSEDEVSESEEPEIDVFSLFDLPADIFAPLEEPMKAHPDALIDRVTLPTVTADPQFPENKAVTYPTVETPGMPRPVVDDKVQTHAGRWIPQPPVLTIEPEGLKPV